MAAAGPRRPCRPGRCPDGGELLSDLLVQGGDLGVDRVDQPQVQRDLGGVDVAEPAGQRLLQLRPAGLKPVVAERGQCLRAALSRDQGVQEPAAAGAEQVRDHHRDLQQRVFEDLLHPGLVPGLVLGQPGPGPGQRPQVPDRLRRHERPPQHAPLVQLAVPHAVGRVALAPPRQVLDVAGVDQPHLQPGRLGQVIPDAPVVGRGFQYEPLDALGAQVVHQRGHLPEGGPYLPHLLPPAVGRDPGTRVHTIPNPFATSIAAAYSTTCVNSSATSAPSPPCPGTPAPSALSFLAAIAASLSS